MAEDVESNFWKEHFTHLQHKNMVRTNAQRLSFEDVMTAINEFNSKHGDLSPNVEDHESFIIWEVFLTETIKLRLFFQYQIKGSLYQLQGSDYVKIADAKFPYNPFPEVEEFLARKNQYVEDLEKEKQDSLKANMKIRIAGEFIKAYLAKKFSKDSSVYWTVDPSPDSFKITLHREKEELVKTVTAENFMDELKNLVFQLLIHLLQFYAKKCINNA